MKTKKSLSHLLTVAVLVATLFCASAKAEDEVFDFNKIAVKSELYVWNRISDVLDVLRCGIGAGGDLGVDAAVTQYVQLGLMVTNERAVDFPHFIPPFWLAHYYQRKPIFNYHDGFCLTAAAGPKRNEIFDVDAATNCFPRSEWDIRLELACILHVYFNISAKETKDFFYGFVGLDPSEDDQKLDDCAVRKPVDQLGRSCSNILFGVWEIPCNMIEVTKEEGDLAGLTKGTGRGIWRFLGREVVGVVELVTFPFGWKPIIEPAYVFDQDEDIKWEVKRPAFHSRY